MKERWQRVRVMIPKRLGICIILSFFAVRETSFAYLDEHLEWLLLENEKNPPTTNVECLHEDEMSIIMKNTREDGSEVYVMSLKKEDLFYRAIFSSERP